jgi:hypothetical protein
MHCWERWSGCGGGRGRELGVGDEALCCFCSMTTLTDVSPLQQEEPYKARRIYPRFISSCLSGGPWKEDVTHRSALSKRRSLLWHTDSVRSCAASSGNIMEVSVALSAVQVLCRQQPTQPAQPARVDGELDCDSATCSACGSVAHAPRVP